MLDDSFRLSAEDSGTPEARITYCAHDGEAVWLVGGRELKAESFVPVEDPQIHGRIINEEARAEVRQVSLLEQGVTDYGQLSRRGYGIRPDPPAPMELFVNGERMVLARWPNDSNANMAEVLDPGPTEKDQTAFWEGGGSFRYDFDRPRLWAEADEIWLDGVFSQDWSWSYNKVAAIDSIWSGLRFVYQVADRDGLRPPSR